MKARPRRGGTAAFGQRGFAMIAFLSMLAIITAYFIVNTLGASRNFTASNRNNNAQVLNQAKQALIGYVAQQAAEAGENYPGRFPCPEASSNVGTSSEGISAPVPSTPLCVMVGRLPWRTLGIDKLLDAAGEPLWYVVSPGIWALQNSSPSQPPTLKINSNTPGSLTVDGQANAAVALIIAPGPAMSVQASPGCTAVNQVRTVPSPSIIPLNYIECFSSGFTTTAPSASFNDQVLKITTADVLPAIEAAIAARIQREIVPVLKGVYASAEWGLSATNPLFPFAAPFANPGASHYQGAAGTSQGLLPFTYSQACDPSTDPRCSTIFVTWNTSVTPTVTATNGIILGTPTCTVSTT
ncbi:MAG TPA: hypothetical protein VK572_17910, partial [Burkholderiales bacterium]|nr:hypothetical protein [Burkholderiales bacterium]